MSKKLILTIVLFCLTLGMSISVFAQSDDDAFADEMDGLFYEDIFASLKSLSVLTWFEDAPFLQGIAENQIKADAETKLRQAGFVIDKGAGYPYLSIKIKSIYSADSISAFIIEVSFVEEFVLARNRTIKQIDIIWTRKRTIRAGNIEKNTIRNVTLNLIDRFVNTYNTAKNNSKKKSVPMTKEPEKNTSTQKSEKSNQEEIPFTKVYIGGNRPPEVEIFNDSNRTLYLDVGQDKMIAYTIPAGSSKKIQLSEGNYNFKATAPRVIPLEGNHNFQKGYLYIWRFTIVKQ